MQRSKISIEPIRCEGSTLAYNIIFNRTRTSRAWEGKGNKYKTWKQSSTSITGIMKKEINPLIKALQKLEEKKNDND